MCSLKVKLYKWMNVPHLSVRFLRVIPVTGCLSIYGHFWQQLHTLFCSIFDHHRLSSSGLGICWTIMKRRLHYSENRHSRYSSFPLHFRYFIGNGNDGFIKEMMMLRVLTGHCIIILKDYWWPIIYFLIFGL